MQFLSVLGLSVVEGLVSSDQRLKQSFQQHGGTQLLIAMASYATGALKGEVTSALKTVTNAGMCREELV